MQASVTLCLGDTVLEYDYNIVVLLLIHNVFGSLAKQQIILLLVGNFITTCLAEQSYMLMLYIG